MKELENHRVALATAKSQYEQAKDGLQRAKETEVSAEMLLTPQLYNFLFREWGSYFLEVMDREGVEK